jgi:hypothetical protein
MVLENELTRQLGVPVERNRYGTVEILVTESPDGCRGIDRVRRRRARRGRTTWPGRHDSIRTRRFRQRRSRAPPGRHVTLDRVVCCYPSWEALLGAALGHAARCLALSYPRDVWYVREGITLENGHRRLTRSSFRTFVHPPAGLEAAIGQAGFSLASRHTTWIWSADVYLRQ